MKCEQCQRNIEEKKEEQLKSKKIIIDGWEYDTETTQRGLSFANLKISKRAKLWEITDFQKFTEKQWEELKLLDEWFFIEHFSQYWKKKGNFARFYASAVRADLYCGGDPQYSDPMLGVRFKYQVKHGK